MPTIDADCHVIETAVTWDHLDASEAHFRALGPIRDPESRGRANQAVISGSIHVAARIRSMEDIEGRLRHMDELGVDIQVLYPTVFLEQFTEDPEAEVALCRSYNRWLAQVWERSDGRLRWAAVLPLLTMDEALEQLEFAKAHGACGVFRRGFEARPIFDPYYFPVFDLAQRLDLPICIHTGRGFLPLVRYMPGESFSTNKLPVVSSCQSLIYHGIPSMFPQLRWGFVEAAAQWLPYVIKDLRRRLERDGKPLLSEAPLRDNRMYVACQTDDDLRYLISYVGEDNLMIGSDYGHSDIATELQAVRDVGKGGEVSPEIARKIRDDNPRALYGL